PLIPSRRPPESPHIPYTTRFRSPIDPAIRHPRGAMARQRLLQVALELFGAQGFQATTTRQIAETAEQTLPAIRYYFGNKEGLYIDRKSTRLNSSHVNISYGVFCL